jgi:transcriptional regulator with XRE-family HTH domain
MNVSESFPQQLARIRKEKGLSQKELAALSGISARMIAHYELYVSHPSLDKIEKLAKALGVSLQELLGLGKHKESADATDFLSSANTKTLKQFKRILQLSPMDRSTIYRMVDSLLQKKGKG